MELVTKTIDDGSAEIPIVTVDWKAKSFKRMISTCGNGSQSKIMQEVERSEWKTDNGQAVAEIYKKQTKQFNVFELLFENCSLVDIHDHYRQGTLGLERRWKTNAWGFRLFCTVLGIAYTDCYLAYR